MTNNIIFIIFVLLFVIVLSFLNTKIEGFEDGNVGFTTPGVTNSMVVPDVTTPVITQNVYTDVITPANTPTSANFATTAAAIVNTPTSANFATTAANTPTSANFATTAVANTPTSGPVGTTGPAPVDCKYSWSNWYECDLNTNTTSREILATQPPRNGGATCTPAPAGELTKQCMKNLDFSDGTVGWNTSYSNEIMRQSTTAEIFKVSSSGQDPYGITKSAIFNSNYVRVKFDNTSTVSTQNLTTVTDPTISLIPAITSLPPGFYLMTYYIQSSTLSGDTQSISVKAKVNTTANQPFSFRVIENNVARVVLKPGIWIRQLLSFEIKENESTVSLNPAKTEPVFSFQFTLNDKVSKAISIVALGGIRIRSCGDQPCNVDCTYMYDDWTYCDFNTGKSTRSLMTIPPVNNGAACNAPPDSAIVKNCFSDLAFVDKDLVKDGWNVEYAPASISNSVGITVTDAASDTAYGFDNTDPMFTTPYTIVNFDNRNGAFGSNTNPSVTLSNGLRLSPGNYRMTYYIQSWYALDDKQSIVVNGLFGTTQNTFNFKGSVAPGVWFPLGMNFTVSNTTPQPVPIKFEFKLNSTAQGENNAVALGGIQMRSCGSATCDVDCQFVWDNWESCNTATGKTRRFPIVVTRASGNTAAQCPAPQTRNCDSDVLPQDCQYSWGEWSACQPGSTTRKRTQITRPPKNHGKICNIPQTETKEDCPIDCQYKGWSDYSSCVRGSLPENANRVRQAITIPPINNGVACTPGAPADTTLSDCPVDCKYNGFSQWSVCEPRSSTRTRMPMTVQPKNYGENCTPPATNDVVNDDFCKVSCLSSYDSKNDYCNQDNGRVVRTYNVSEVAKNQQCIASDKEVLVNNTGSQTREIANCEVACKSSVKSERCDRTTGLNYKIYDVTKKAINRSCVTADNTTITNQLGNSKEYQVGICPKDCAFSHDYIGCNDDGHKIYRSNYYSVQTNGGNPCMYKGTLVSGNGQTYTATAIDNSELCAVNCRYTEVGYACNEKGKKQYISANYKEQLNGGAPCSNGVTKNEQVYDRGEGCNIQYFTNVGETTWTAPYTGNIQVAVIGGGGGGGSSNGTGGNAGEYKYNNKYPVIAGKTYNITVGYGGNGVLDPNEAVKGRYGLDGANSIFDTITAAGGAGGRPNTNDGGNGAGGAASGKNGGPGVICPIDGKYYAFGGGGADNGSGSGSYNLGGDGGKNNEKKGTQANSNTGGGGGASGDDYKNSRQYASGSGGSGIVIIAY